MTKTQVSSNKRTNRTESAKKKALDGYVRRGTVTAACKEAKIARRTWYDWIEKDQKFAQAVEDAYEQVTDEIEECLLDKIRGGDTQATIFALKSRRRAVYGDKAEMSGPEGGPIQVDVRAKLDSQLAAIAERRREKESSQQSDGS
jgi:hypothetical protein